MLREAPFWRSYRNGTNSFRWERNDGMKNRASLWACGARPCEEVDTSNAGHRGRDVQSVRAVAGSPGGHRAPVGGAKVRRHALSGRGRRGRPCRHRLPVAGPRPHAAEGPVRRRAAGVPPTRPSAEAEAAVLRALPPPVPGVRRPCRGPPRLRFPALLGLQPLALVRLGELAAAAPAGLPGVRRPEVLVAVAAEHRLSRLRPARPVRIVRH
jgi:hypothetical protein